MPTTKIRALVRRLEAGGQEMLVYGPLIVYLRARNVIVGTRTVALSPLRWSLLLILVSHAGKTVSKDRLRKMLAEDTPLSANGVEELVSQLRGKLEPGGIRIRGIRGRGYCLELT